MIGLDAAMIYLSVEFWPIRGWESMAFSPFAAVAKDAGLC
jgi:hypothetical protein